MISSWITHSRQTVDLGVLPADTYIMRVLCHVTEAFNSGGTDEVTVGNDLDPDAIVTTVDVSSTGIKSLTLGVNAGYNSAGQQLKLFYSNGGGEPTAGAALFLFETAKVPTTPV